MTKNVLFNPQYVDALRGDHMAALMLSQIVYWSTPAKDGRTKLRVVKSEHLWLVKSHQDWWTELRMTRRQSQRALEILRKAGVVETVVHRFKNVPTLHIRLIQKHLQGLLDCTSMCPPIAPVGAVQEHQDVQPLTETTTETTTENTEQAPTGGAETPKQEPDMDVQQTLKNLQQEKPVHGTGLLAMQILWKKRVGADHGYQKPLTGQEVGQLKHVHKQLQQQAVQVLDYALLNWVKFAMRVQVNKGLTNVAMAPHVGFFCTHYDVAVQLIAEAEQPKSKPVAIQPLVIQSQPAVGDNLQAAQVEDVQQTLEQLKALQSPPGG